MDRYNDSQGTALAVRFLFDLDLSSFLDGFELFLDTFEDSLPSSGEYKCTLTHNPCELSPALNLDV